MAAPRIWEGYCLHNGATCYGENYLNDDVKLEIERFDRSVEHQLSDQILHHETRTRTQ
jgi:hypothetical protein